MLRSHPTRPVVWRRSKLSVFQLELDLGRHGRSLAGIFGLALSHTLPIRNRYLALT